MTPRWAALVSEVRAHPNDNLANFLDASGRSLEDVLRKDKSWTSLRRTAGKLTTPEGPLEQRLVKRVRALAHLDDQTRRDAYTALLNGQRLTSSAEQRFVAMLFYSLFPDGGDFTDAAAGLTALDGEPVIDEMREVIDIAFGAAHRIARPLVELAPALADVPLAVHARYSREEILAALGWTAEGRSPSTMREGVAWCPQVNADAFLITLKKTDTDYSPTTMYRDYALNRDLFHWESQSTTSAASPTGQRYLQHRERGSHILLFVRENKTNALGPTPYIFLGPSDYVSHEGDRPIAITWHLRHPMPTEVYLASRAAVA